MVIAAERYTRFQELSERVRQQATRDRLDVPSPSVMDLMVRPAWEL